MSKAKDGTISDLQSRLESMSLELESSANATGVLRLELEKEKEDISADAVKKEKLLEMRDGSIKDLQVSLGDRFRVRVRLLFLYTVVVLFHISYDVWNMEWCIRQLALVFFNHTL